MRNLNLFFFSIISVFSSDAAIYGAKADCRTQQNGVVLTDPLSCRHFYQCYNGYMARRRCLGGLFYDDKIKMCNIPQLVQCTGRGIRMRVETSTAKPIENTVPQPCSTFGTTTCSPTKTTAIPSDAPCSSSIGSSLITLKTTTIKTSCNQPSTTPPSSSSTTCSSSAYPLTTIPCNGQEETTRAPTTSLSSSSTRPSTTSDKPSTTTPYNQPSETTPDPTSTPCSSSIEPSTTTPCKQSSETTQWSSSIEPSTTKQCVQPSETTPDPTSTPCTSSIEPSTTTPCDQPRETTPDPTSTPCSSTTTLCNEPNETTIPISTTQPCDRRLELKNKPSNQLSDHQRIRNLCFSKSPGTVVRDPNDCAIYYMCNLNQTIVRKCSLGLYFDIEKGFCNFAKFVKCDAQSENL